ncbi:hypothetical protein CDIK_3053, partial [Cucumispora dikerogammari]
MLFSRIGYISSVLTCTDCRDEIAGHGSVRFLSSFNRIRTSFLNAQYEIKKQARTLEAKLHNFLEHHGLTENTDDSSDFMPSPPKKSKVQILKNNISHTRLPSKETIRKLFFSRFFFSYLDFLSKTNLEIKSLFYEGNCNHHDTLVRIIKEWERFPEYTKEQNINFSFLGGINPDEYDFLYFYKKFENMVCTRIGYTTTELRGYVFLEPGVSFDVSCDNQIMGFYKILRSYLGFFYLENNINPYRVMENFKVSDCDIGESLSAMKFKILSNFSKYLKVNIVATYNSSVGQSLINDGRYK